MTRDWKISCLAWSHDQGLENQLSRLVTWPVTGKLAVLSGHMTGDWKISCLVWSHDRGLGNQLSRLVTWPATGPWSDHELHIVPWQIHLWMSCHFPDKFICWFWLGIGFELIWSEGECYVLKMKALDIELKKFDQKGYWRTKNCFSSVQLAIISSRNGFSRLVLF